MKNDRRIGRLSLAAATVAAFMLFPAAYGASDAPAGKPAKDTAAAQRALDLEHDMVQSDGVNHPRETVKQRAGTSATPKAAAKAKNQRDLDLEHEMNQTDGARHPREKVGDKPATGSKQAAAPKKTQADLDQEHERMLSDGTYHPREVLKK